MRQYLVTLMFILWAQSALADYSISYDTSNPLVKSFMSMREVCIQDHEVYPGIPKEAYYVTLEEFLKMQIADTLANVSPHELTINIDIHPEKKDNYQYIVIMQSSSSPKPGLVRYDITAEYYKVEPTRYVFAGAFHIRDDGQYKSIPLNNIFAEMALSHNRICNDKLAMTTQ